MGFYYVFDASKLLEQCWSELQLVIQADERSRGSHYALYDLQQALATTERILIDYVDHDLILQTATASRSVSSASLEEDGVALPPCAGSGSDSHSLAEALQRLQHLLQDGGRRSSRKQAVTTDQPLYEQTSDTCSSFVSGKSSIDALLFRLIVLLQLCQVHIDDARCTLTGQWRRRRSMHIESPSVDDARNDEATHLQISLAVSGLLGAAAVGALLWRRHHHCEKLERPSGVLDLAKCGVGGAVTIWLHRQWQSWWMSTMIGKSTEAIEAWNEQWSQVYARHSTRTLAHTTPISTVVENQSAAPANRQVAIPTVDAAMTQRLVEYAMHDTPASSFWHSQGELRFLMLKRAMDVFYASVGTAVAVTGGNTTQDEINWQLNLVSAAAASFYSLTGASAKANEITSSSQTAQQLIENAWGMVSLPSIKNLSLQASRIIKGAAVADRLEIAGVSCFVLSREPAPEVAAAIKRWHRKHGAHKKGPITKLSTIDEESEQHDHHLESSSPSLSRSKPFARASSCGRYRQRDIIFHLTGGGFFAHIIASDLPYLLDWSASTGAVVICPEYALLPRHAFPDALLEVEAVYRDLTSDASVEVLGFEVNQIVVTGESAGGNLAAALCVKIAMEQYGEPSHLARNLFSEPEKPTGQGEQVAALKEEDFEAVNQTASYSSTTENLRTSPSPSPPPPPSPGIRLPDALMLSCAVLNLSLDVSYSRILGHSDPVLPTSLLSAISNAYIPPRLRLSKQDPLVSPLFASDAALARFPPTLLFASSNDPLLDDSVVFNQRLRCLRVPCELRAAQNLPHAYLGLGTAGFPEALQVQAEIVQWLREQLVLKKST